MTNLENVSNIIAFSSEKFSSHEVRTSMLMSEFTFSKNVYFFESPIVGVSKAAICIMHKNENNVTVVQPYLPNQLSVFEQRDALIELHKEILIDQKIEQYAIWTDTPRSMPFIRFLNAEIIVYDCSLANAHHLELEKELFEYADVVLTSRTREDEHEPRDFSGAPKFHSSFLDEAHGLIGIA